MTASQLFVDMLVAFAGSQLLALVALMARGWLRARF